MKRSDVLFLLALAVITVFLILPTTHRIFFGFTDDYYLLGGFIKFFLFATLGDVISHRIKEGDYLVRGIVGKAFIWGIIGVVVVMVFMIFTTGVSYLHEEGVLPLGDLVFFTAFTTSVLMNLLFAPTMMLFHRISDEVIELKVTKGYVNLKSSIRRIDFPAFFGMLTRTIPFFWIPAHTITFLLPQAYRPFFAAVLGIMLGLFLNLYKKSH